MPTAQRTTRRGYVPARHPTRTRPALVDTYANEIRLGDLVTPAPLPGPAQLPRSMYGKSGTVVSLGRVRIGVRFEGATRIELLPSRPLRVVRAVDGRSLLGPPTG